MVFIVVPSVMSVMPSCISLILRVLAKGLVINDYWVRGNNQLNAQGKVRFEILGPKLLLVMGCVKLGN